MIPRSFKYRDDNNWRISVETNEGVLILGQRYGKFFDNFHLRHPSPWTVSALYSFADTRCKEYSRNKFERL